MSGTRCHLCLGSHSQSAELYPIFADLSLNRFANVPLADCLKLAAELLDRILLRGERQQIGKKGSALS